MRRLAKTLLQTLQRAKCWNDGPLLHLRSTVTLDWSRDCGSATREMRLQQSLHFDPSQEAAKTSLHPRTG